MYDKTRTELPNSRYALPGVVVFDGDTTAAVNPVLVMPSDALVANCDSCGAQLWLPSIYTDLETSHRTYCNRCLEKLKKV
jgi:hypothetical protein